MKKYFLAAALVLVSTSAMADRIVVGSTHNAYEQRTKLDACEGAKNNALSQKRYEEDVEQYSACSCEQQTMYGATVWRCTVDAKLAVRH